MMMTHQRHLVSPEGIARAIAADLTRPASTDGIDVIKSERGTLVWQQTCPDAGCDGVFKLYRHINPVKLFRSKISKGRRAKREFAALSRLSRAGVPCSEPLDVFCGRTPEAGRCEVLVTKCIEGGIPLETLAGEGRGFAQIDLAPLYQIVRRAHESGTYHGALSPRNILVTGDAGAEPGFFLIDMERSILFPYDISGTRMAWRDLLSLCMYVSRYEGTGRIPGLLSAYGLPDDKIEPFMADLSRFRSSSLERDLVAMEFGIRSAIERRWDRVPSGWLRTKVRDHRDAAVTIYYPLERSGWVETAFRYWNGELQDMTLIKGHAWGGVTESNKLPGLGKCFFKRFSIKSPRFLHKPPRARHTVVHQGRVSRLGFDVPEVLCLMERRRMGVVVESAVITLELKDCHSINSILNLGNGDVVRSLEEKRQLLRLLGQEIGRWHASGLFHGDMHCGNIFCRRTDEGFALSWIDNEEGSHGRWLPMRLRLHDLDHVNRFKHEVSLADRMRVWAAYVEATGLSPKQQRAVRRRVIEKSQRFWRKKGWMT
jgi:tRNA A-37 threonylcarbamoyl transferase component Bud32